MDLGLNGEKNKNKSRLRAFSPSPTSPTSPTSESAPGIITMNLSDNDADLDREPKSEQESDSSDEESEMEEQTAPIREEGEQKKAAEENVTKLREKMVLGMIQFSFQKKRKKLLVK